MNLTRKIIAYLQLISGTALFASLPIYFNTFTQWAMILFITTSIMDSLLQIRFSARELLTMEKIPFWACIGTFLLLFVYLPIDHYREHWNILAESRLAFLLFGILGLLGTRKIPTKVLAYTSIIVSTCLIGYLLYLFEPLLPGAKNWKVVLNLCRTINIQAHMAFNLYLNIAIISCFWLFKQYDSWIKRAPLLFFIGLFYTCIALSDGRIGIVSCNIIMVIGFLYLLPTTYKKKALFIMAPIALAVCFVLINNHFKQTSVNNFTHDYRYAIWKEGAKIIAESPVVGIGAGTGAYTLSEAFKNSEHLSAHIFLIEQAALLKNIVGAHPHNQFMQSWMEHGIPGLLCAFGWLIVPLICLIRNKSNVFVITIWTLIIIQMQTDVTRGSLTDLGFCFYLLLAMNYAQQSSKEVVNSK